MPLDATQFLGLPSCGVEKADALILPLPLEKTVSYGGGTAGGPWAILAASLQLELFDETSQLDFAEYPRVHTLPPLVPDEAIRAETVADYLEAVRRHVRPFRGKLLLSLGGEHTLTYGTVTGLVDDPAELTLVQLDAHADLIDELDGRRWSHGTVARRLWEEGCSLLQIGVRSLSRAEHELIGRGPRITTYYAHQLERIPRNSGGENAFETAEIRRHERHASVPCAPDDRWETLCESLRRLEGKVYLSIDVDGLDPAILPSTGTPQPGGLTWQQTMEILDALRDARRCDWIGADVVEYVPAPHPPGCDPTAARLVMKVLAAWTRWREQARR